MIFGSLTLKQASSQKVGSFQACNPPPEDTILQEEGSKGNAGMREYEELFKSRDAR